MTTDPKYAVRVNDFLSSAEASKVAKIICNGRSIASGDMLRFARWLSSYGESTFPKK